MWILPRTILTVWSGSTAMEACHSELNEWSQACASSLLVRSKPTRSQMWSQKWKRDSWSRFLFGRTVRRSHVKSFTDWWTCSLRDTHAKASVRRVSARASATLASYGLGFSKQQSLFAPAEFFLRTSRGTSRLDSEQCSAIWRKQVSEQRGEYSRRLKSARLTPESACSSMENWATPQAHDAQGGKTPEQVEAMRKRTGAGVKNLNEQVQNWPTPTTPRPHDNENSVGVYLPSQNQKDLTWAVATRGPQDQDNPSTHGKPRAQLNPDWVEQLMGLPIGWTACASAGTESFQQPQLERIAC